MVKPQALLMFTTIITDCYGENEKGRQVARFNSLGLGPTNVVGVGSSFSNTATIEGGANLVDILDATEGKEGLVVVNVAPRGNKKEGSNGNNFCYFYYKKTLVISTTKDYCLSFVRRFDLAKEVKVVKLAEVLDFALNKRFIDKNQKDYITKTQFRSFDFVPRLARFLIDGISVPSYDLQLTTHNIPSCVWHIDAFGNTKLTLTSKNLPLKEAFCKVKTNLGDFTYYDRLKDVRYGETAIYTGSSGIGKNRFLELATQGIPGSAAKTLKLKIGDRIEIM